jgi:hypothetical protein
MVPREKIGEGDGDAVRIAGFGGQGAPDLRDQ